MRLVVDPRLLLSLFGQCPLQAREAAEMLARHEDDELLITTLTDLSLSPMFSGGQVQRKAFLDKWRISVISAIPSRVVRDAYEAWRIYQEAQPDAKGSKRMFDALYAGAFARVQDGILTAQPDLYRDYFKGLTLIES